MLDFFGKNSPINEEKLPEARADKIKAAVLSLVEEEKPMKKHFSIKPLIVAAAVMTTGALCAISAGAAANTNVSDLTLPGATAAEVENCEILIGKINAEVQSFREILNLLAADQEFLYEDSNGTRHYRTIYDGEMVVEFKTGSDDMSITIYDVYPFSEER